MLQEEQEEILVSNNVSQLKEPGFLGGMADSRTGKLSLEYLILPESTDGLHSKATQNKQTKHRGDGRASCKNSQ